MCEVRFEIARLEIVYSVLITGGKPVDPAATNSVFELLYQICCATDQYAVDRVTMMLNWLVEVANVSIQVILLHKMNLVHLHPHLHV